MLSRGHEQRRRRASPVDAGRITVSFRPAIPWRVAPQQSPLPLRRPRQSTPTLPCGTINTAVLILSHPCGPSAARATSRQLATAAPHRANLPRQNTFAGEVFNMTCRLQPTCFLLVPHRRCRPAVHEPPPERFPGASRDPSARLLSAGRVGPGFPPGQRIYRIVPLNHLVSF